MSIFSEWFGGGVAAGAVAVSPDYATTQTQVMIEHQATTTPAPGAAVFASVPGFISNANTDIGADGGQPACRVSFSRWSSGLFPYDPWVASVIMGAAEVTVTTETLDGYAGGADVDWGNVPAEWDLDHGYVIVHQGPFPGVAHLEATVTVRVLDSTHTGDPRPDRDATGRLYHGQYALPRDGDDYPYYPGDVWRAWPSTTDLAEGDHAITITLTPDEPTSLVAAPDGVIAEWTTSPFVWPDNPDYSTLARIQSVSVAALLNKRTYRFEYVPDEIVTSGAWLARQRQNPQGNAGGWPARQRQDGGASGAWASRHRQTGR